MKNSACIYCGCLMGNHKLLIIPDKIIATQIWGQAFPKEISAVECANPECKKMNAIEPFVGNKGYSDKINTYVDYVRSLDYGK